MKWLSESNAVVYVKPIRPEDMMVTIDCDVNGIPHSWGKVIPDYKCPNCGRMRKIPLQGTLREAELAYRKTLNGLNT